MELVSTAIGVGGLAAPPVDQHQVAVGAKAAQVHLSGAGRLVGRRLHRRSAELGPAVTRELRQAVQNPFDRQRGGVLEHFGVDRHDRAVGLEVLTDDARAGDHDAVLRLLLLLLLRERLAPERSRSDETERERARRRQNARLHGSAMCGHQRPPRENPPFPTS
jgi:hypothetical protein